MALARVERLGDKLVLAFSGDAQRELELTEGSTVTVQRTGDSISLRPRKYKLDELLEQCDYSLPMSDEEREWIDAPAVGRELI